MRRSLVGPCLLILIGGWFLFATLRPELPLLDMAARYWPVLLIVWGALRLFEILIWALRRNQAAQYGIGAGEWVLIVFVCLIGSGLYTANRLRPWEHFGFLAPDCANLFGHSYHYTVSAQTKPAPAGAHVVIENLRGTLHLAGSGTDQVSAVGKKSIRAMRSSDADKAEQQSPLEITAQGNQVVVRTNQDRVTGDARVTTDLDVTVPRTASVEVRGRNGEIFLTDLDGNLDISSDEADVHVRNAGGNVQLDLRKSDTVEVSGVKGSFGIASGHGGDLDLENIGGETTVAGSYSGDLNFSDCAKPVKIQAAQADLRVEAVPGQLHLNLGDLTGTNLTGPVRFSTSRSRDVRLDRFTGSLDLSLDGGDVKLRPATLPVAGIVVHDRSGEIALELPEAAKFDLKASTNRGELNNEFGPALRTEYANSSHAGGTILGGAGQGPQIVLNTDRGEITIGKDTGSPIATMPPKSAKKKIQIHGPRSTLTIEND